MDALRVITEEHRNLWRIATTLDQGAKEIEDGGVLDPAFFTSTFDYIEHFIDYAHHKKEDDFLFYRLRQRCPQAASAIEKLQTEHRDGPVKLEQLRDSLLRSSLRDEAMAEFLWFLRSYTSDLRNHIRIEEKEVFPLARECLVEEDWASIDQAFLDNKDPLFSEKSNSEFRELFHHIANLAPDSFGLGSHSAGGLPAKILADDSDVLLKVSQLESDYGRIKALKGIDLEVRRGELVALVGSNGAGKTTFLRALSGVQPMSAGSVLFDGEDISKLRADLRMKRGICQSPEGRQIFGPLSIEDNLRLGAYTQPKHQVAPDMEKVFAMFPILKEKRNLPAGTLSGGQQQMLAIGRALMGRPKLLLLDEPSMGLAPLLVEEVFNVVKTLKAQGMTILLVEQNAFAALTIADRAYVLETGTVTLTGTGKDLLNDEKVRAAYLGM